MFVEMSAIRERLVRIAAVAAISMSAGGACKTGVEVDSAPPSPIAETRIYGGDFSKPAGCSIQSFESIDAGDGAKEICWVVVITEDSNPNGSQRVNVTGYKTKVDAERACQLSGIPRNYDEDRTNGKKVY